MSILVFDCETTGLIDYRLQRYPFIVQLSWLVYDGHLDEHNHIIKTEMEIPDDSVKIHRITNEMAQTIGKSIQEVLNLFIEDVKRCRYIVAHNMSFDMAVVKREMERWKIPFVFDNTHIYYCTMKNSIDLCKIRTQSTRNPNEYYNKFPKLIELFKFLFPGEEIVNLHDALVDNIVCLRCYYQMTMDRDLCAEDELFKKRFIQLTM